MTSTLDVDPTTEPTSGTRGALARRAEARPDPRTPRATPTTASGWRSGRPLEDPEKTKRWGFVTAQPSEFLVTVRRGRVVPSRSGQGATVWKWPWDAVAVVPTSLQQLRFTADQVTAEKVGVEVVGLAVYRIADPLLAYRVLNFSFPERAQQKLAETLTQMFVGAARRLVANLSVADCLQRRKGALAEELIREVAPVVGGHGRADDTTAQGWGVVIDTIEIQEVRVLSDEVFAALQAPYRAELDRAARAARAEAEAAASAREADATAHVQALRLEAERRLDDERRLVERARREAAREDALRALEIEHERAAQQATIEAARLDEAARLHAARERELVERQRLARLEVVAEVDDARLRREAAAEAYALERQRAEDTARLARVHAAADAERLLAEGLPRLAEALGERMGSIHVTQVGAGSGAELQVAAAMAGLDTIVRAVRRMGRGDEADAAR
jgi:flotillin